MGAINDVFLKKKISFSEIENILKTLTSQTKYQSQNKQILQEIGLLKEYSNIISDKSSDELIYYSIKNKIIKSYIKPSKIKSNFVNWTKFLFDINNNELDSEQILNIKKENLKNNPLNKMFFQNNLKKYLFKDKSFNKLINYGIPNNLRAFVWDIVISEKYTNHKYFNYEEEQKEYNAFLKNTLKNSQIEKDINRTFMQESEKTEKNIEKLRNILNCVNKYHNHGYFQGMNFIAGFLLRLTKFEEIKAFYIFKYIFLDIKGYFEDGFPLLKYNLNIFDKYFKELYPELYNHFKKNEVFNELWVGKWFQTLFTLSLPFEELCYIWDILLINGFDYIVYISLSIIEILEKFLLELNDSSDIYSYLQNALNPKDTIGIYKKIFENINEYIIPLKDVLSKASDIEKKIKENYKIISTNKFKSENHLKNYDFNNDILKMENKIKYNNGNELKKKNSSDISLNRLNSPALKSLNSSNYSNSNILATSNIIGSPIWAHNLNNKFHHVKFEQNVNNNLTKNNKSKFYSTKNVENDHIRINNKRKTEKIDQNSFNKLRNLYNFNLNNNIPSQQDNFVHFHNYSNFNMASINRPQYTNYLVFYA